MTNRAIVCLAVALVASLASGCTRRYMQFDYDYPARGLASRVHVERQNREPLNAAAPLQITLRVNAPEDSTLVLIVHHSVAAAEVVGAIDAAFRLGFTEDDSVAILRALAPFTDDSGVVAPAIRIFEGTSRGERRHLEVGERLRIAELIEEGDTAAAKAGAARRLGLVTELCRRERRRDDLIPITCTDEHVVIVPPSADSLITLLFDVERGPNQPHRDSYDVIVSWLAYPVLRGVPDPETPTRMHWPASTQCGRGRDAFCQQHHYARDIRTSLFTGTTRFAEINFWFTPAIALVAAGAVLIASE